MAYDVRPVNLHEVRDLYINIVNDFAQGEYPPYEDLYKQLEKGIQKGFVLVNDQKDVAYSICTVDSTDSFVLISLLAVYTKYRGKGFGTKFIEILKNRYCDKRSIIVEVEKPEDALEQKERDIREKRIKFYEKAGFILLPDIDYAIWDIPMYLMILPNETLQIDANSISSLNETVGKAMGDIYLKLLGKKFFHKMELKIKNKSGL
ncbi:GNAT family N-acetyltransferase [Ruminiclostridium josui]|uniref:GNAT family N-acetyltransferase n=1 Tax=Ruminiclostridium josui TaxID=1499 RepID=UPI0004650B3C|nr:GNAT family N-acetyltransferase [Ruminiclostridium josui]